MSTVTHQYALIGDTVFQFKKAVVHVSELHGQIVICSNGPDIRYATLEEWEKAGTSFDRRAQLEGIVTSASPARDKLELFRNLFTGRKDVYAHGYRRKDGGDRLYARLRKRVEVRHLSQSKSSENQMR